MNRHRLDRRSSVCALIPHYECDAWLPQAIESLLDQSRPPDAILVIDDGSKEPPAEIVASYPGVSLVGAPDNGGPYRLIQSAILDTGFDAYLFQDADDWSAPDRLELLLDTAELSGAELVGSHELRVLVEAGDVLHVRYPLDVNAVLAERPTAFPLLHPTSLVGRDLVMRLGGFASGMRFSGDAEFLRRAGHAARVVNADHFGYFRRKRVGSLTTDPATALHSEARRQVQEVLAARARRNARLSRLGKPPDLRPWRVTAPARLKHLAGPPIRPGNVRKRGARKPPAPPAGGPVFLIGAPRSGQDLLAWSLAQHSALHALEDSRWLARAACDVERRAVEEAVCVPAGFRSVMARSLGDLAGRDRAGRRWVAAGHELTMAAHALAVLFPEARFLNLMRSPGQVVASLSAAPTADGAFYGADAATRVWLNAVEEALLLEEALGGSRVLRVHYRDLVAAPESCVRRCLHFLGEEFEPGCLRPLLGLAPESRPELPWRPPSGCGSDTEIPRSVQEAVDRMLVRLAGEFPQEGDAGATERLAGRFKRRALEQVRGSSLVERLHALVSQSVPEGAVVAVVSKGDPRLVELDGRTGRHLPQAPGGGYAGFHPPDSEAAVEQLLALHRAGADYLVVPATALWWLTYYEGLASHLARRCSLVAFHEEVGAVYRLTNSASEDPGGKPGPPAVYALPAVLFDPQEVRP